MELVHIGAVVDATCRPVAARAVPVAKNADGHGEQHVRHRQGQDQVPQGVLPAVPRHHHVRVGATVVAGEWGAKVGVPVLFGELRAVYPGRVAAPLGVDEEPGLPNVPLQGVDVYVTLQT